MIKLISRTENKHVRLGAGWRQRRESNSGELSDLSFQLKVDKSRKTGISNISRNAEVITRKR